ncbi:hypothetical protein J2T07_002577 [Luteibacter jiangsuensis]|uniref:Uncharacterized protein n=1 Tax=Luteibacter jiangsuensis TaxID=637577 RepID=A0ABT9T2M7_9GAMM|nr:hypothetical protein [Luteibacter jiangsuensis]MDQ0010387.1 hypothetical protein [Luteibacter jiangsuensis]
MALNRETRGEIIRNAGAVAQLVFFDPSVRISGELLIPDTIPGSVEATLPVGSFAQPLHPDLSLRTRLGLDGQAIREVDAGCNLSLPGFECLLRILDRFERMDVETLISQSTIERLDHTVLFGTAGKDKVQMDAVAVRPFVDDLARKLGAVIHGDHLRLRMLRTQPIKGLNEASAVQRKIGL